MGVHQVDFAGSMHSCLDLPKVSVPIPYY